MSIQNKWPALFLLAIIKHYLHEQKQNMEPVIAYSMQKKFLSPCKKDMNMRREPLTYIKNTVKIFIDRILVILHFHTQEANLKIIF